VRERFRRYDAARSVTESLEGTTLGIYRLLRELGRGGMGTVYEAESTAPGPAGLPGSVVAVKVFHAELLSEPRAFERFETEAAIGRRILHPHLVRTYYLGRDEVNDEAVNFIVMELIQGQTLKGLKEELGTVPEQLLYAVADQVLSALEEIHDRGVVHRDIKPENIVITPEHRVLLMDLGVALQEDRRVFAEAGEFVGSLIYAPPEQFEGQLDVGPRADLYALGVTLFELATGGLPFSSTDINLLIQQKLYQDAPPPRSMHPDLDDFLDQVIATTMLRAPADRFASAGEMRRILREGRGSAWWRQRREGRRTVSADLALRRLRMDRIVPMAGRDADLERLREAHGEGAGGVVLLGGPPGIGKSRLLYEYLLSLVSAGGPIVVAGKCGGSWDASGQPFQEAFSDLVAGDEADPDDRRTILEERVATMLPDTPGAVAPVAEFLAGGGIREGFTKEALHGSFARMLACVREQRPALVVIEDLHAADEGTLEIFAALARTAPDHGAFLFGTYRDDEVEAGSALERLLGALERRLLLAPLEFPATEGLVRSVVRHEATVRALARALHERSDGNPHIVLETLLDLRSQERLVERADGLDLVGSTDEIAVPSTQLDIVSMRLSRLDDRERETLETAAVMGAEFDADLFAAVLRINDIELRRRLAVLERKHRLLVSSGKERFRFASRQVHDAIYESIGVAVRGEVHSLVADTMLERIPQDGEPTGEEAYHLLHHLLESGRVLLAEPYLERAVEHVTARHHAARAVPFLERVLAAVPEARPPKRFALAMGLWRLREVLGDVQGQRQALEVAREAADAMGEPGPRGQVHLCTAGALWRAGDHAAAGEEARQGRELARKAGDRKWEANALHVLGAVEHHRGDFSGAAKCWREALAIRREIGDRRGEAASLQALGAVMPLIGEMDAALETKQASLRIFREIGDRRGESALLNNVANSLVDAQRLEEALETYERARAISRELGSPLSEATQLSNVARARVALGRIEDARKAYERSLELFRMIGNPDGEVAVLNLLGPCLAAFGDFDKGEEYLRAAIARAEEVGARGALAAAHRELAVVLHEAGRRDLAREEVDRALAMEEELKSPESRFATLSTKGRLVLVVGDVGAAASLFEEALELVHGGQGAQGLVTLCRLARAYRGAGRDADAAAAAERAERVLAELGHVGPDLGPEVHFTLALFSAPSRKQDYLDRAQRMVDARSDEIRNDTYREHYRTRVWPNFVLLGLAAASVEREGDDAQE